MWQGSSIQLRLKFWDSSAMHALTSVDRRVPDDVNGTQSTSLSGAERDWLPRTLKPLETGFCFVTASI